MTVHAKRLVLREGAERALKCRLLLLGVEDELPLLALEFLNLLLKADLKMKRCRRDRQ